MNSDSTRDAILAYIQTHRSTTAADIAESMNLTGAAVRYHLGHLRKANLIEIALQGSPTEKRGRPAQFFCASPGAVPNNLSRLANALLEDRLSQPGSANVETWRSLSLRLVSSQPVHVSLTRRLPQAIEQLNQMNYASRWEAGPRGPRILFSNCPYASLLPAFPGLCQMDSLILENLLGKPVSQTSKMDIKNTRVQVCIFETA
jgi:predicted ArsR family transcriptional regulator